MNGIEFLMQRRTPPPLPDSLSLRVIVKPGILSLLFGFSQDSLMLRMSMASSLIMSSMSVVIFFYGLCVEVSDFYYIFVCCTDHWVASVALFGRVRRLLLSASCSAVRR